MAVPKRKHSSARRDKRRASTSKIQPPALCTCSQCGELKSPHRVCGLCGFYNGKEVVAISTEA